MKIEITKPLLASVRECLASLFSHSELSHLFLLHDISPKFGSSYSNKMDKCSAHIDHLDYRDNKNIQKLIDLLTEARARKAHQFNSVLENPNPADSFHKPLISLNEQLTKRGIFWADDKYCYHQPSQLTSKENDLKMDISLVLREVQRARDNAEADPADSITAAENILVSTCKHILDSRQVSYQKNSSVPQLLSEVLKILKLVPDEVSDATLGSDAIRRLLRSFVPAAQSLSELRNLYGDAHGKGKGHAGLQGRHARLMIGVAETISMYLLEIDQSRT